MSFWKLAPYAAGGVGVAALENQLLGSNLPDPMKKINLGIGATTGLMLASPNEASRTAALGSIPLKQMSLFGLSEAEKFKNQQESLTNTNLNTARLNESAANLHLRDAGTSRAVQLAFLIPALVGAGALGYDALEKYRKAHKPQDSRFKNISETGKHKPNQKFKMELPVSALPDDFVPSLLAARDRSHMMLKEKGNESTKGMSAIKSSSLLGTAGNFVADLTGIPALLRGGKDLMHSYGSLQDSDYGGAGRYGAAGLGNLALGVTGARLGIAPLLGYAFGKPRLAGVIRNAIAGRGGAMEMPSVAKYLYRHSFANEGLNDSYTAAKKLMGRAIPDVRPPYAAMTGKRTFYDIAGAYDPKRFAWNDPTTKSTLFRNLLTAPGPGAEPRSLTGSLGVGARYLGNRAVNAGYGIGQAMKRWPNLSLTAAALPVAHMGTERDEANDLKDEALWDKYFPNRRESLGPMGMPVSSVANSIIGAISGRPEPIAQQMSGI